jgi:putative oxidoreductase
MTSLIKKADLLYSWFLKAAEVLQSVFLLFIRWFWGYQLLQTGWGKLTHLSAVIENFRGWGVPAPSLTAPFISVLETTAGILFILGLGSRLIAFPMTINMIVAYLKVDREAWSSLFSDSPEKFFSATPFPFLVTSLLILLFGPGKISLDALIEWYRAKRQKAAPVPPAS